MTATAWCKIRSLVWGLSLFRWSCTIRPNSLKASLMSRTRRRSRALLAIRLSFSLSAFCSGVRSSSSLLLGDKRNTSFSNDVEDKQRKGFQQTLSNTGATLREQAPSEPSSFAGPLPPNLRKIRSPEILHWVKPRFGTKLRPLGGSAHARATAVQVRAAPSAAPHSGLGRNLLCCRGGGEDPTPPRVAASPGRRVRAAPQSLAWGTGHQNARGQRAREVIYGWEEPPGELLHPFRNKTAFYPEKMMILI